MALVDAVLANVANAVSKSMDPDSKLNLGLVRAYVAPNLSQVTVQRLTEYVNAEVSTKQLVDTQYMRAEVRDFYLQALKAQAVMMQQVQADALGLPASQGAGGLVMPAGMAPVPTVNAGVAQVPAPAGP